MIRLYHVFVVLSSSLFLPPCFVFLFLEHTPVLTSIIFTLFAALYHFSLDIIPIVIPFVFTKIHLTLSSRTFVPEHVVEMYLPVGRTSRITRMGLWMQEFYVVAISNPLFDAFFLEKTNPLHPINTRVRRRIFQMCKNRRTWRSSLFTTKSTFAGC